MSGILHKMYHGETKIDFIGKRKLWFAISGLVILACLASLFFKNLNFGIEFEGGVTIQAPVAEDGPLAGSSTTEIVTAIRDVAGEFGADDAKVQVATGESERTVSVQTKDVADDPKAQSALVEAVAEATGAEPAEVDNQQIGSKWGGEITDKAVRALLVFMLVVLVFISWRFEWKMGVAALVALVHDLIITAGVYSLVGFEVTPSTVIAILTILGYSLYDTVVVFDKVEENTAALATTGRMTYQDAANLAMNQVFMRSLNTSLATLLPVAGLLFIGAGLLGAGTLKDLSLALFVGILTGSYSSIFVATPVLSLWKEKEPKYKGVREKVLRDAKRAEANSARRSLLDSEQELEAVPATPGSPSIPATPPAARPGSRPRPGNKKAKRRKRR